MRESVYNGLVEQRGMDGEGGRVILNGKKVTKRVALAGKRAIMDMSAEGC